MSRWLRALLPGYDFRGRLKYLKGRESCSDACMSEDVDRESVQLALTMIADAFAFPQEQVFCLRPDDELMSLYRSLYPLKGWPDDLEFVRLALALHEATGTDVDFEKVKTVRDVVEFLRMNRRRNANSGCIGGNPQPAIRNPQ